MRVINLAHGATMALSMFGLYFLFTLAGLNPYLALPLVALLGLAVGLVIYGVAVHRVINAPPLSSLLATFAVNMMLIGTGTALFTTSPFNITFDLGRADIGPLTLPVARLVAAGVAVLVAGSLYLFLYRTRPGKMIRAVANNRQSAELMGIPSSRMLAVSFGLGVMLASVAGGLIATFFPFTILSGSAYQLNSFVIGVLGGLGNPLGALIGGLILGLLEGLVSVFLPVNWVPVIEFGLFVLILLIRPSGLFGARQ
jgi:branched-subunit amino acid ABC-type transport system permease component